MTRGVGMTRGVVLTSQCRTLLPVLPRVVCVFSCHPEPQKLLPVACCPLITGIERYDIMLLITVCSRKALWCRSQVRSFLGGRFLDNGEGTKVERCFVGKLLTRFFPKTPGSPLATFSLWKNRALKNDHTPVRHQSA